MAYVDKQGLFADFNFKLVVIDAMLEYEPAFLTELKALKEKHEDAYWKSDEYEPIPEVVAFVESLELEQTELDKVTNICFDGGNEIYFYLLPDWDGEDGFFDITSIEGWEHLKNLKEAMDISMIDSKLLEPMKQKGIKIT